MASIRSDIVQVHPYRILGGVPQCLVLRRSPAESLYPGIWQVITGSIEPGECSRDTALREVLEETGYAPIEIVPFDQPCSYYLADRDEIVLSATFGALLPADCHPTLCEEHDRYLWLPAAAAIERLTFRSHREGVALLLDYLERRRRPRDERD